ncbi:hypothetical protein RRG49_00205 [Mycoplasmopsis felis]|uniref:hypothetical protein n=2 Tax=Mycoplasmopsis felis TaxID=33923 RepID=UPI0021AFEDA2|nr:hypothetical protein [Mycoplasmopsis felis]MCU9931451.1 hypothetical protein [Mycoplasmopsis felis]MCU9937287.1 hypothetical protein [Mycoplasmopsis felis]UWV84385.1 hypothetical protein NWE58_02935 [Mycoplasmopsis felis]UWW00986.1 hypothetical protein NW064_00800 [Mycoplasmopsis felis]WAM01847.1 hypothetical protein ONA02_04230 [Mycoplasmopsis felis]
MNIKKVRKLTWWSLGLNIAMSVILMGFLVIWITVILSASSEYYNHDNSLLDRFDRNTSGTAPSLTSLLIPITVLGAGLFFVGIANFVINIIIIKNIYKEEELELCFIFLVVGFFFPIFTLISLILILVKLKKLEQRNEPQMETI